MIRSLATIFALLWTAPLATETVEVRGRGSIDLAPFACTDTPRSSVVQRVCYDAASRDLLVEVRGSYRDYCRVPAATYHAFVAAPSMGQFYRQTIAPSALDGPFDCGTPRAAAH